MAVNIAALTTIQRVRLYQGQPGTTATTLYTVPAATDVKVTEVVFCNTSGATATVTLSAIASGGTAGATNRLFNALDVASNETVVVELATYLTAAGFLSAQQSTSGAITVTVSGETYA